MGAMFAPLLAGGDMAQDVQSGFLHRLALLPLNRTVFFLSSLAGTAVVGLLLGMALLVTGILMGSTFVAGVCGVFPFLLLVVVIMMALGAIGNVLALQTGSAQAVAGMFGASFSLVFFSTGIIPRQFIEADWFKRVADLNPVSHLIAGVRSLITVGWDVPALLLAFVIALVVLLVGLFVGERILSRRLV